MHCDPGHDLALAVAHRHGDAADPGEVLLVVDRVAAFADRVELVRQALRIGQGLRRVLDQRSLLQKAVAAALGHRGQEELAARRCVQRHPRAGAEVHAQRPGGLDTVEVQHRVAVGDGQVAGLADLLDQLLEDRVARGPVRRAEQHLPGELVEPFREAVALGVGLAGHHTGVLERAQDAQHGRLGQRDRLGDLGELRRPFVIGQGLEDADGPQDGRTGRDVGVGGCDGRDGCFGAHDLFCLLNGRCCLGRRRGRLAPIMVKMEPACI